MSRRLTLLTLAALSLLAAVLLAVTGGFAVSFGGLRLSARSPEVAVLAAALAGIAWWWQARGARAVRADLIAADAWLLAAHRGVVLAIAALVVLFTAATHSRSAAGADASGYLSDAAMLIRGTLRYEEPLAALVSSPDERRLLAPLGWQPSPAASSWSSRLSQSPTYAVGLPLLMAPLLAVGGVSLASLLIPVTLGLAVWATAALASRAAGGHAAIVAAVAMATSPVALFEAMQVMSDVPVTAAWMTTWLLAFRGRSTAAGVVAAVAVLIRPNLAPLALLPAIALLCAPSTGHEAAARPLGRLQVAAALRYATPVAIAGVAIAGLQWLWYGSPLRSGYGAASEIYAIAHVAPNAALYLEWLRASQGSWLLLAPLTLVARREGRYLLAFALLVIAAYLIYAVFEVWTYLRFLLPGMAVAMVGAASLAAVGIRRAPASWRAGLLTAVVLLLASLQLAAARDLDIVRGVARQQRAREVGERLASRLPSSAVIVSGEQSGAMRFYTGRSILRWDLADRDALSAVLTRVEAAGHELWVVLDDWEEPLVRARHPALAARALDQPPVVISAPGQGIRTAAWQIP